MTTDEGYHGVGRTERRRIRRRWKESGTKLSLKEWAKQAGVGDAALVWLESKKQST